MAPENWTVDQDGKVTPALSHATRENARENFAATEDIYKLQDIFTYQWFRHPEAREILAQRLGELDGDWVVTELGIALERYSENQLERVREVFADTPTVMAAAETFIEGYREHRDVEPIYRARVVELEQQGSAGSS